MVVQENRVNDTQVIWITYNTFFFVVWGVSDEALIAGYDMDGKDDMYN